MRAALLPDRGVVKVAGDGARNFLHGLVTADILNLQAGEARFCALLTPQGKIIADFIVAEAPAARDGGGFFLDIPRALGRTLVEKLNLYKLRAKVIVEDLSELLGVLAAWDGSPPPYPPPQAGEGSLILPPPQAGEGREGVGLCYADPRLPALGTRVMLPPHLAAAAAADLGADLVDASEYEAHRIALGVPRGGLDFSYGDAFPHETDMDQLGGVDFVKGCYVGQEVVSRMEHRGTARTRAVPVRYDGAAPEAGAAVACRQSPGRHHGLGRRRKRGCAVAPRPRGGGDVARRAAHRRRRADPSRQARLGAICLSRRNQGRRMTALVHADGAARCPWPKDDPLYIAYHDDEWGVPEFDDRALYEKLVLDGFQAGLSWITILRKRENFRRAFDGFFPEKIARYRPGKIERLMQDAGIVRNRAKIEGAVLSARAWIEVMEKGPGFSKFLWHFVDGRPKVNRFRTMAQVPAETATSRAIAKELAQRGFKFCGPTIVYAFMQAVGMVNDHLVTCHRHEACQRLGHDGSG